MIRHDYVATDSNVMFLCAKTERAKGFVNILMCEQRLPLVGVERHEIKRMNLGEEPFEAPGSARMVSSLFQQQQFCGQVTLHFNLKAYDSSCPGSGASTERGGYSRAMRNCSHGALSPCLCSFNQNVALSLCYAPLSGKRENDLPTTFVLRRVHKRSFCFA